MLSAKGIPMVGKPKDNTPCSYCGGVTIMVLNDIAYLCDPCTEQFLFEMETYLSSFLFDDAQHRA